MFVVNQVNLITGAPKTGKTLTALYLAKQDFNKRVFKTKFKNFFRRLFRKDLIEMPLFYSTIPVSFPYVPLTEDILMRVTRPRFNSVIFIDEAYLVADSMSFKDDGVNESLSLFNKLIGHEMHGGSLWYNTQNVHDCHFAMKRVATTYLFLQSKQNYPFFMRINCRELINSEEVAVQNTTDKDVQDDPSFHTLMIPKTYFKKYDCYAYSILTDYLPVEENVVKCQNLKTGKVISMKNIIEQRKKEKINNEKK